MKSWGGKEGAVMEDAGERSTGGGEVIGWGGEDGAVKAGEREGKKEHGGCDRQGRGVGWRIGGEG